jgi:DNA-binding transcriptional MerR regulator
MNQKSDKAYKSIGEVAKILELVNDKKGTLNTHTIRFWEKNFKQIKPKIFSGNRRYYNNNSIEILRNIKHLLKNEGMTINGVKKILNSNQSLKLDEGSKKSISYNNLKIKNKLKKISSLVKEIKKLK